MGRVVKRASRRWGMILAVATSFVASAAVGQTPTGTVQVKPASEEEAKRLFDEGQKAFDTKQWEKARDAFMRAYAAAPLPRRALALARAELMLGKHRDAAEHFALGLREAKDLSSAEKKDAEASLAKCTVKVGALVVKVEPAGAEVFVDDTRVGTAPLAASVYVEPGSHRVEAKLEGKQPVSERVGIVAGASLDVEMTLRDAAGESSIIIKDRGKPGGPVETPKPIVNTRNKKVIYAGIGVGAGLAAIGLGTGIAAGIIDKQSFDEWDANGCTSARRECREAFDEKDKLRSQVGSTAVWFSIGAVIVGGATVVYALTGKKLEPKTEPKVTGTFVVLPGGGGVFGLMGRL